MAVWNKIYDILKPTPDDDPKLGDDEIRNTKEATRERLDADHYFPLTGSEVSDADAGEHRKITLRKLTIIPSVPADKGLVHLKDVASIPELFYKDKNGNEIQLTSGGKIRPIITAEIVNDTITVEKINSALKTGTGIGYGLVPSGCIILWSGIAANIPAGWALCNGAYGTPNLRDRFIVGAGYSYNPGNAGGENTHTLTTAEMPAHNHTHSHTHQVATNNEGTGQPTDGSTGHDADYGKASTTTDASSTNTSTAGGGGAHENRPPYYALCYIMKL